MNLIRIDTRLEWQIARDNATDRWIAVCPPLAITAEAESWEKLAALLAEEVNELLLDLLQEGELPAFLRERGWHPMTPVPVQVPHGGLRFDVPMEMRLGALADLAKGADYAQARARN